MSMPRPASTARALGAKWLFSAIVASIIIFAITVLLAEAFACWLGGNAADRVQAIGGVVAIIVGGTFALFQLDMQRAEAEAERSRLVQVAYRLAFDALQIVGERLDSALTPASSAKLYALRGDRARETIEAMRELAASSLPADVLQDFTKVRSYVFAINQRLSEIYDSEDRLDEEARQLRRNERPERLKSSVRAYVLVLPIFGNLGDTAETYGAVTQIPKAYDSISDHPEAKAMRGTSSASA